MLECTSDDWARVMNTNLRGVFFAIRAFAPAMVEARSGHIINISSLAGRNPLPGGAIYSASKWGLNGLSYALAEELRAYNIRVSVVSPGSVNTGFSPHEGHDPKRMLTPGDVAHAVATAGDATAAIVHQRDPSPPHAEAVEYSGTPSKVEGRHEGGLRLLSRRSFAVLFSRRTHRLPASPCPGTCDTRKRNTRAQ